MHHSVRCQLSEDYPKVVIEALVEISQEVKELHEKAVTRWERSNKLRPKSTINFNDQLIRACRMRIYTSVLPITTTIITTTSRFSSFRQSLQKGYDEKSNMEFFVFLVTNCVLCACFFRYLMFLFRFFALRIRASCAWFFWRSIHVVKNVNLFFLSQHFSLCFWIPSWWSQMLSNELRTKQQRKIIENHWRGGARNWMK